MKMKQTIVAVTAFQRIGRAVTPGGETTKLHIAVLARQVAKRPRQFHVDADNVRRQRTRFTTRADIETSARARLDGEFEVGDDPSLAGIDHIAAGFGASKNLAFDQADPARSANAGAAVMRKPYAIQHRAIEQQVAAIRVKCFLVQGHPANVSHHSTSTRIGRTCLVCLIWLWSNAATLMKTPLLSGTSY